MDVIWTYISLQTMRKHLKSGDMTLLITLAYWPAALNPSTSSLPCPPQPSTQFTAITNDLDQSLVGVSGTVHWTITPRQSGGVGLTQLDSTMWYVCAWYLYTADNSNLYYPEPGWTNFTVTSTTTGYCNSPIFTNLASSVVIPITVNHVIIIAYDGSWDTWICDSVANTCDETWSFENTLVPESPPASCTPTLFTTCSASLNGISLALMLLLAAIVVSA